MGGEGSRGGPGPPPACSVVVCTFTEARWDDLLLAAESARAQSLPPVEIIVVVDHNEGLLRRARRELRHVRVLANSHMRGASGARNTGAEMARGEVVAFLDDDAQASSTWLSELAGHFRDPAVAGVGGAASPVWPGRAPGWFPPEFGWVVGCSYRGLPPTAAPVRNPVGTNMAARRALMLTVGGFREGFGNVVLASSQDASPPRLSTGEETDFCIRVATARPGLRWLYEPAARVQHRVPPSRTTFRYFLSRCWLEGRGKAALAHTVGPRKALASERAYVLNVLPGGVGRGLRDAGRGRWAGVLRAGAIAAGLATTAVSYLVARHLRDPGGSQAALDAPGPGA